MTRKADEKWEPDCYVPRYQNYSSCMAWSIIIKDYKKPLIIFENIAGPMCAHCVQEPNTYTCVHTKLEHEHTHVYTVYTVYLVRKTKHSDSTY